jgi:hypothetical protein
MQPRRCKSAHKKGNSGEPVLKKEIPAIEDHPQLTTTEHKPKSKTTNIRFERFTTTLGDWIVASPKEV